MCTNSICPRSRAALASQSLPKLSSVPLLLILPFLLSPLHPNPSPLFDPAPWKPLHSLPYLVTPLPPISSSLPYPFSRRCEGRSCQSPGCGPIQTPPTKWSEEKVWRWNLLCREPLWQTRQRRPTTIRSLRVGEMVTSICSDELKLQIIR